MNEDKFKEARIALEISGALYEKNNIEVKLTDDYAINWLKEWIETKRSK